MRHSDGRLLPVEVSWRAIMSGDGWNIVGIASDIRARLAAEQTMHWHAMQPSLIAAFGRSALADTDLDHLLSQAADGVAQGLGVAFSAVLQLGPDNGSLVLRAGVGWPSAWV